MYIFSASGSGMMFRIFSLVGLFVVFSSGVQTMAGNTVEIAASSTSQGSQSNDQVVYTFFINSVPDGSSMPLIGFINTAYGNYYSIQAGFINSVTGDINGAQFGFVNATSRAVNGLQMGYVNQAGGGLQGFQAGFVNASSTFTQGFQAGFVNTTGRRLDGFQAGFVNRVGSDVDGAQVGFVNVGGGDVDGLQVGFVNVGRGEVDGAQVGFVNVAQGEIDGAQVGFVNRARKLNGLQLGFINVVDTVESGFPIGFISVVRKGGYKALGFHWDESSPYNLSFRIGLKSIYSVLVASYNPALYHGLNFGAGLGSYIPLNDKLFFNPELISMSVSESAKNDYQQTTSLTPNLGINLSDRLLLTAGPTFNWRYTATAQQSVLPGFTFLSHAFNQHSTMHVGVRVGALIVL